MSSEASNDASAMRAWVINVDIRPAIVMASDTRSPAARVSSRSSSNAASSALPPFHHAVA
jgi:hypothetical protein